MGPRQQATQCCGHREGHAGPSWWPFLVCLASWSWGRAQNRLPVGPTGQAGPMAGRGLRGGLPCPGPPSLATEQGGELSKLTCHTQKQETPWSESHRNQTGVPEPEQTPEPPGSVVSLPLQGDGPSERRCSPDLPFPEPGTIASWFSPNQPSWCSWIAHWSPCSAASLLLLEHPCPCHPLPEMRRRCPASLRGPEDGSYLCSQFRAHWTTSSLPPNTRFSSLG